MPCSPGLWPSTESRPAQSHAEGAVYDALKTQLPAGWYAWHSLRIRTEEGLLGEGDFVLADPARGLLVLEVKGGRLEQRDGRWVQNGQPMERAPLEQALGFAHRLSHRLEEKGCRPPAFGAAVMFPETAFERPPTQDDLAAVTLGKRELAWLSTLLPKVLERALPPPRRVDAAWLRTLHELWGETWIPRLSLGRRARDLAEAHDRLDPVQIATLEGLLENSRVLLRGPAGSGKTLLAAEAALRLHTRGERVLLLCFTRTLAGWLTSKLAREGLEVQTVSGLAHQLLVAGGHPVPLDEGPEFWKMLSMKAAELTDERRWDAIIVDEAQDLTEENWLLVSTLSEGRRLWALCDESQCFWADRGPPLAEFETKFRLTRGHRCPNGIQALADGYAGAACADGKVRAALQSGELRIITAPTTASAPDKIALEVDRLLSDGLALSDIAIVSLRGQTTPDAVFQLPSIGRHKFVRADHPQMQEQLVADSFLRWKGLERPAVIITDLGGPELSQRAVRMYVALTRALLAVRVVAPREQLAADPTLAALA